MGLGGGPGAVRSPEADGRGGGSNGNFTSCSAVGARFPPPTACPNPANFRAKVGDPPTPASLCFGPSQRWEGPGGGSGGRRGRAGRGAILRGGHDLSCPRIPPAGHFTRAKPPKLPPLPLTQTSDPHYSGCRDLLSVSSGASTARIVGGGGRRRAWRGIHEANNPGKSALAPRIRLWSAPSRALLPDPEGRPLFGAPLATPTPKSREVRTGRGGDDGVM